MQFTDVFVIFLMVLVIILFIKNHYGEVEYVKSKIDDRFYLVRKLSDSQEAADYLASVNTKLQKLVRHMEAKYDNNKDIHRLFENFNPNAVSEGSSESGYTSYSINKGESLILCIRQKDSNTFVDMNIIMYVAIHELSHIMTNEIGHTDMFWRNFRFLLEEAIKIGEYKKVDFSKNPQNYCGITITNSII